MLEGGALSSVLSGGGGGGAAGGEKPGPLDGNINAGAQMLALGSHAQALSIQRQGRGTTFGLGFLVEKLLAAISPKKIGEEIASIAHNTQAQEIAGTTSREELEGGAPVQQAQNFAELIGNSDGMLASAGVTGGIDTSGSVTAMAGGGGSSMSIG